MAGAWRAFATEESESPGVQREGNSDCRDDAGQQRAGLGEGQEFANRSLFGQTASSVKGCSRPRRLLARTAD